jgi:hypothetical protein
MCETYREILDEVKETLVCKKTVFVILCLISYMLVQTAQQSQDGVSGRAGNVMTRSNIQMAPDDMSEIDEKLSTVSMGKHKPSKLGVC